MFYIVWEYGSLDIRLLDSRHLDNFFCNNFFLIGGGLKFRFLESRGLKLRYMEHSYLVQLFEVYVIRVKHSYAEAGSLHFLFQHDFTRKTNETILGT